MTDRRISPVDLLRLLSRHFTARLGSQTRSRSQTAGVPRLLVLETSSLCNLACSKCGLRSSTRERGLMDIGLAKQVIYESRSMGIEWMSLSMLGEPLLHPGLAEIIAYIKHQGMHCYFTTNGLLLTEERSRELIDAGVDGVYVSIDGWDGESYSARHSGAELETVLQNLEAFRRAGKNDSPLIASVTTLDAQSRPHLDRIKKMLTGRVDQMRLSPLTDFGIPGHQIPEELLPGRGSWRRQPCHYLWSLLNVGWDGTVTACCNDHNYLLRYGHTKKTPLSEIWQNEKIKSFRRLHLEKQFHKMPMCGRCTRDYVNSLSYQFLKLRFDKQAEDDALPET